MESRQANSQRLKGCKVKILLRTFFLILGICVMHDNVFGQPVYHSSDYRFQHFDVTNGLPSDHAQKIVQDSLGYLWILHDIGVSRYDGYTFKLYPHDPNDSLGLGPPLDGSLERDKSGGIWVFSNQGYQPNYQAIIARHDRKKDRFIKYFPDLDSALVMSNTFDKENILWLGAGSGRGLYSFDASTGETKNYLNNPDGLINIIHNSPTEQQNTIFGIIDRDSILLLATWRGVWKFDKKTEEFSRPKCHPSDSSIFYNSPMVAIREWLEYNDDLYFFFWSHGLRRVNHDLSGKSSLFLESLKAVPDKYFLRDRNGIFWLADGDNGLYRYGPRDSTLTNLKYDGTDQYALRSNRLTSITIDRDQNLWITTEDHGISKLSRRDLHFHNYDFKGEVTGNTVYSPNKKNCLVVSHSKSSAPGDNDILVSDITLPRLESLDFKKLTLRKKIDGRVNQLAMGRNRLWIGTWESGFIGLNVNPYSGLIEPETLRVFKHGPGNSNTISSDAVSALWEDREENLWVGTRGWGLNKVIFNIPYGKDGSVIRYKNIPGDSTSISNNIIWWELYPEDDNSFWVITGSGLELFRNGTFEHYFKNDYVGTVKRDSKGNLFVGTVQGLYESKQRENFKFFKHPSKVINDFGAYAFQEDKLGRFWISTHAGILCYDRKSNTVVKFAELEGIDYTRDWVEQTSDGVFITADAHGVSLFDPSSFKVDYSKTRPVLTHLTINNKNVMIEGDRVWDDAFNIKYDISVLDELTLDYQHNNFAIEFSVMEMTAPEKNLYRHKLEGYDQDWIETDWKNRTATYTNLDAGNYFFKVRASNSHGIWSDRETTLHVRVLPPPWKTWWAYTGYSLIAFGLLFGARRMVVQRERLKANLNLAKVEQEKEHFELEKAKEVDVLKSRFFANISHEFRTPITLVVGPLKDLHKQLSNPDQKSIVGSVIRNGQRLQRLINQLLDLSKVEAGKMKLLASQVDLVLLLREITSSYESLAKEKNIRYFFNPEVNELMVYVDEEKIEKITHNILSNAFKFTKQGGQIILNLKVQEKSAVIAVTDSGIGIPQDQLDKIFDRFYQVDSSQTRGYEGSGLGLALVKDLVELHHGKVSVESKEGKGTTFTVSLPLGMEHLQKEEIVEREAFERTEVLSQDFISTNGAGIEKEVTKENGTALEHPVVLIVEDNADMRQYIHKTLSSHYQMIEAENGREGVSKAEETMPDLIISDIMMPEMDGYKLCGTIKSKELTSHIPVILLTAKADRESKLSGLEIGADDYLAKPFDADELKLIVRNRIEERRKMREHFSREITLEPRQVAITSLDEKFISKVLTMIESHMDDEEFSIEDFSQEAGCSRVQFYRKIKGLTDQTPSQFVRSIRLKRAAQLLLAKSDNVSQIAYSVGFSSLAYFNKCFKEQFGITPGQYAEANKTRV